MVSSSTSRGRLLEFGRHAQGGGDDADLALAAGEADGDAGAAAEQEHLPVRFHDGQQFGNVFSLSDDHGRLSCVRFAVGFHRAGAQFADRFHHVGDVVRQGPGHGGGNVDHAEAFLFEADFLEHVPGVVDPAFGAEVAFDKMAAAFEAAGHQHAVRAVFKRLHEIFGLQPARAGGADDAHVGRILDAHGPRQIGRGIGAIVAAKGQDLGLKDVGFHGLSFSSQPVAEPGARLSRFPRFRCVRRRTIA